MENSATGSVTNWLRALQQGSDDAGYRLWNRYFHRMVAVARRKLGPVRGARADEEDVAISAFDSFCAGLRHGRFPLMQNRDDVWAMLIVITLRKAIDAIQHDARQKRGGGRSRELNDEAVLQELLSREPCPASSTAMSEELDRLLAMLDDDDLRQLVVLKLEGHNNTESAELLGCARVTVQRMLKLIRQIWEQEMPH